MSFNIEVAGGTSVRLPTAGKYCDRDIVVSATGAAGDGASLNFEIVGAATAPSNPKENTIWINTNTTITNWTFSATQPETAVEGMVWISVGASSPVAFNALKENVIQVYPISAKQFVSGEWVDVVAKSYQSNTWVDWWKGELYTAGNEWSGITGGWYGKAWKFSSAVAAAETINIDREDSYIKMYYDSSKTRRSGVLVTTNKIDLTDYNTLTFNGFISQNGSSTSNKAYGAVYIFENLDGTDYNSASNRVAKSADLGNAGKATDITLDVSGLSGSYYIGVGLYTFDAAAAFVQMNSMVLT